MVIDIPFTSYTPDLPPLNNPGLVRAHNCYAGRGAGNGGITLFPLKSAALYSATSMSSRPLGTAIGQDSTGNAKVYAGSADKLYHLVPATRQWTDISRSGGYSTTDKEHWKAVQFGSGQILTNFSDYPQVINMDLDLQFADLTSLVKGRHIAVHKGFTFLANTWDSLDGFVPYRIRWSALENPYDWTFSAATQSDFQDISNHGNIQALCTDENLYILMQHGIVAATYIGAPYVYQFQDIVIGKGCTVPESVVSIENRHFFLSDDGFYCLQGGNLTNVGFGKINSWFLDDFDINQAHLMTTAVDPRKTLVYWSYVSKDAVTGTPDKLLILNYATGEWSTADATTAFLFNAISLPVTIDQLDEFASSFDTLGISFDDPAWAGGASLLWGMDTTGNVYAFSGPALPLQVETPELSLAKNLPNDSQADIASVSAIRPLFNGEGTARVQVGTRSLQNSTMVFGSLIEANPETGFCYARSKSRYHRFRMTLYDDWSQAFGIQIDGQVAGRR